ncbi:MAG: histidine--tRNA ligase [Alphaproteobacteria bacterium]|nr:histidine--tRNA ligase [Alphaproteobacteria bacterium]MBV8549558.1 histidine--tRNA ligase [Alphaproteobacteria bacterium]
MSLIKPRTIAGTMELLPREQMIFQHIFDTIRHSYERFGFIPIETPVFEEKDILLTKSGGETEKQVYFVQSTGSLQQGYEADMALRFDLTVPLARYVAEHERELNFPFRRYQMQRVYRGERAQRGRFREFYQCDIDVIGKDKLDPIFDAELPAIIAQIFESLRIGDFTIHFSNRKILLGLLSGWGVTEEEKRKLILREVDKLDKIGTDKVRDAIAALGLTAQQAGEVLKLIAHTGSKAEVLAALKNVQCNDPVFVEGLNEVSQMVEALAALGVPEKRTRLNLAIARGLDYYTGTVYETTVDAHPEFGSVCSGGRYENLASYYTKSKLPGVGISIGLTRLFDLLTTYNLMPQHLQKSSVQVLIAQMDVALRPTYLTLASMLRTAGYNVENYLEPAKLDKQLKYADRAGVPLMLLMGTDEFAKGSVIVKDLAAKTQTEIMQANLVTHLNTFFAKAV